MTSFSKHLMAGYLRFLGQRDYGGLLETCKYYRLSQGEVDNVSFRHLPVGQRMLAAHILVIRLALRPCEC